MLSVSNTFLPSSTSLKVFFQNISDRCTCVALFLEGLVQTTIDQKLRPLLLMPKKTVARRRNDRKSNCVEAMSSAPSDPRIGNTDSETSHFPLYGWRTRLVYKSPLRSSCSSSPSTKHLHPHLRFSKMTREPDYGVFCVLSKNRG
jgi:hypothetical protein